MFQNLILNLKLLALVILFVDFGACSVITDGKNEKTSKSVIYCQSHTPCGWLIYNFVDYPDMNLINDYCICRPWQKCVIREVRIAKGVKEYRCKTRRDLH